MKKEIMLGNAAVARGLYEAGCQVISSYPGTPSTEITEEAALYPELYCEWAPNEKVAAEVAIGASIAGARSFCAMKHVGLNVAADPLFTASYTGVNGGMVLAVADDPGMHSSQNEQDSRHYAQAAKVPMLEPSDSEECKEFARMAYDLSEQFDTPVILRLSTRVSHSQSMVEWKQPKAQKLKEYRKDPQKYVMMPAMAKQRHVVVEKRMQDLRNYTEECPFNRVEKVASSSIGVITSGVAYEYVKEVLGESVNILKLGLVNPLPEKLIKDFSKGLDTVYVIEELDDIIETFCKKIGVSVVGKEVFPWTGEYSQTMLKEKLLHKQEKHFTYPEQLPARPPVMCAGCPHRGLFFVLHELGLTVSGDIGCYTLGAQPPLAAIDTTICMGASVSGLHGFNKARGAKSEKNTVAVIGDSTFAHSGITGLVNIVYNRSNSTVIILDNSITGMTGHQQNPTTGYTIRNEPTTAIDMAALCHAVGIKRVTVIDPNHVKELKELIQQEVAAEEPSVIICRRPCALLKQVKHNPPVHVDTNRCRMCKACFKVGCPAIVKGDGAASIDTTLCVGCGLCTPLCPFGAISEPEEALK